MMASSVLRKQTFSLPYRLDCRCNPLEATAAGWGRLLMSSVLAAERTDDGVALIQQLSQSNLTPFAPIVL